MTKIIKVPLSLDRYSEFSIDQKYSAFSIDFLDITNDDCDNYEYEYLSKGYKIFSSEVSRSNLGNLKLTLIIAKIEMTF